MAEYQVRAGNLPDDEFVRGYLECAEWCGIMPTEPDDESGESGSEALELSVLPKWTDSALAQAQSDCDDFRKLAGTLLDGIDESRAGHDLWLTRNGHGAGFWDRGLGKTGDTLSDLCRPYGEAHVDFDPVKETLELV